MTWEIMWCDADEWRLYLMIIINEKKKTQHIKPSISWLSSKDAEWVDGMGKGLLVSEIILVVHE